MRTTHFISSTVIGRRFSAADSTLGLESKTKTAAGDWPNRSPAVGIELYLELLIAKPIKLRQPAEYSQSDNSSAKSALMVDVLRSTRHIHHQNLST